MRRTLRAVALSAAALLTLAATAGAARAQTAPAAPYPSLSEQRLGHLAAEPPAIDQGRDRAASENPRTRSTGHAVATPQASAEVAPSGDAVAAERPARSLADLVYENASAETPDEETDCLARAVYWESKGEPLVGQLAVADVIINRAQSGRFASTICGVVRQPSQFSFVRGGHIPPAPQGSDQWHTAVAIARIARQELAGDAAPQALFFHARSVHPGWRLTRVASVGNHIFYR